MIHNRGTRLEHQALTPTRRRHLDGGDPHGVAPVLHTDIAPVPLERVPEVGAFLTMLGLGVLGDDEVSAFRGGTTPGRE